MGSPFPGMDPYLEQRWGEVHTRLIVYATEKIFGLPSDLSVRIEERVYVQSTHESHSTGRSLTPDVRVVEARGDAVSAAGTTAVAEPVILEFDNEPMTERYIEIVDPEGGRVITVIEFLSPANKLPGHGRDLHLKKRADLHEARVNLVEIDLVRAGERDAIIPHLRAPKRHQAAYHACIWRACEPLRVERCPFHLSKPLPAIHIPLRETDPDATLDLQSAVEMCYLKGRLETLDYTRPLDPPFSSADADFAQKVLKKHRLSTTKNRRKHTGER